MTKAKLYHKIIIALLAAAYFLIGYLTIAYLPRYASFEAATFIDKALPLIPFFIIFYFLGYAFPFTSIFIIKRKKELYWLAINYFLLMTVSFIIFILLPIEFKKEWVLGTDPFSKMTSWMYSVDSDFNNFPSLHVTATVFAYLFIRDKSKKVSNYLLPFLILIIVSTLFVKQHLVIDIVGGLAMAFIFYHFFKRYKKRAEKYLA